MTFVAMIFGYVDPGSGSLLLQLLLATGLGAMYWSRRSIGSMLRTIKEWLSLPRAGRDERKT
jgi:hypothetical protein